MPQGHAQRMVATVQQVEGELMAMRSHLRAFEADFRKVPACLQRLLFASHVTIKIFLE